MEILSDVAILPAELERVLSLDPRHQVIEDVGGASRDVSIVDPGRLTKLSKAVTEAYLRRVVRVVGDPGDPRQVVHELGVDRPITLIPVQITAREVIQQVGRKGVVPVEPIDPRILRIGERLAGQLLRQV